MKIKNDVSIISVKFDHLLPERTFLDYCRFDYHHHHKLNIDSSFLSAAEKDGFIFPLEKLKETKQENGEEKEVITSYYSPHQIYIIAALAKNQVYDGLLWSNDDLEFYKQQGFRMVNWGWSGYAFNITLQQKNKGLKVVEQKQIGNGYLIVVERGEKNTIGSGLDYLKVCSDFNNFLMLFHSLKQLEYSLTGDRTKDRLFSQAPSLYFDISSLSVEGEKTLKKYRLNIEELKSLAYSIASLAVDIDPLEYWYYYINHHSQMRKDLFKGDAALAQELYRIYDLLIEVIEVISKVKQPPIFEFLYGQRGIRPYLIPSTEYVNGIDVKSMWVAVNKFRDWMKENKNKDLVEKNTLTSLDKFEKELKEYENKYGARSCISNGIRQVEVEEKIKFEDLDPKTKQYVTQIIQQAKKELAGNKHQFLSIWGDEFEERVKNKEITLDQAKKEDNDLFIKREVFDAIEQRLRTLKRELWVIFDTVQIQIARKVNEAWDIEQNLSNHFWFKRKEELAKLSREKQLKLYDEAYRKAYKEAQYWSRKRDNFGDIESTMNLLYCSSCRQRPIVVNQSYNERHFSGGYICEDCLTKIKTKALSINEKDWAKIREGEWKCDFCGQRTLYKFAYNNIISLWTYNKVPIKSELHYGRLTLEARCPSCNNTNIRDIDWGWNP